MWLSGKPPLGSIPATKNKYPHNYGLGMRETERESEAEGGSMLLWGQGYFKLRFNCSILAYMIIHCIYFLAIKTIKKGK